MSKGNDKKLFSIETTKEEHERGMELLEHFSGERNGDKLSKMFNVVENALARNGLPTNFSSHIRSIDDSIENISANVVSIVKAAEEERKHNAAELQEHIESQAKTVQSLQRENESLIIQLAESEKNMKTAEAEVEAAKAQAAQLEKDKAFYEASARDKEDLNNLLRDKVATLQEDVLSSEEKMDSLQKENDALRAEVESLKRENAELQRAQEAKTANLDSIIAELNDPPV